MAIRIVCLLLGLAAAVGGILMLLRPALFARLDELWEKTAFYQKLGKPSATQVLGVVLLLVGIVLCLVMPVSLAVYLAS
ncbi:hypothetical protein [Flavonifractor sp. An306]|uniref:hypothetical protein n=1 Tax=Flavonifractor sp. An306 TaxID=1965629 RepID=UPI000B373194|nr:hypothetical protein [Flavonifractor sp. An306]OUO42018.1 hypothetical protein B5F88_05345 [Flavonifractor sp. An306]